MYKKIARKIYHYYMQCLLKAGFLEASLKNEQTINLESVWPYKDPKLLCPEPLDEFSSEMVLSFIVPLYNSSKHMDKCIQSMIRQNTDYQYEIILVNDGSKDDTLKKAMQYKQQYPSLIYVYSKENSGISDTRNLGIIKSRGKYLCFVDHDDYLNHCFVQTLLDTAIKQKADVVKCGYRIEDSSGKETFKSQNLPVSTTLRNRNNLSQIDGYIWGNVISRDLFSMVRFPSNFWYEDMITRFLIYLQADTFIYLNSALYNKIDHKENASKKIWSNKNHKALEELYLLQGCIDAMKKLGIQKDELMVHWIIDECGETMVSRIVHLDNLTKKTVFLTIREIFIDMEILNYIECCSSEEKKLIKAILTKQYRKWIALGW